MDATLAEISGQYAIFDGTPDCILLRLDGQERLACVSRRGRDDDARLETFLQEMKTAAGIA